MKRSAQNFPRTDAYSASFGTCVSRIFLTTHADWSDRIRCRYGAGPYGSSTP